MSSPEEILTAIETELDNLEQTLLPLLTKPWSETLQALKEPLDRAKLNVCVGFGVVDLIWIFLKLKSASSREKISFEDHPVMRELARIQAFHHKIKSIESPPPPAPKLDIPAAQRFIHHAIPRTQRLLDESFTSASESIIDSPSDVGMHSRFRNAIRTEDVEKLVPGSSGNTKGKERAESESDDEEVEDDLMVVGEGEDSVVEEDAQSSHIPTPATASSTTSKRQRDRKESVESPQVKKTKTKASTSSSKRKSKK